MKRILLPILAIGVLLLSACGATTTAPPETVTITPPPETITITLPPETVTVTAALKEFTIEGFEWEFSPASITVNQGDRVKITFKDSGLEAHNLVIDEFGVTSALISPGATTTVEFTADTAGTFFFYCGLELDDLPHRELGMEGEITVK